MRAAEHAKVYREAANRLKLLAAQAGADDRPELGVSLALLATGFEHVSDAYREEAERNPE